MSAETVVYEICPLDALRDRKATAFRLLRRDEEGAERVWSIVIMRWGRRVFGYINACPHQGVGLDMERNQFMDPTGKRLMCGKHGALFDIGTGECLAGPCVGQGLEKIDLHIIDGDVCVAGVELIDSGDGPGHIPEDEEADSIL